MDAALVDPWRLTLLVLFPVALLLRYMSFRSATKVVASDEAHSQQLQQLQSRYLAVYLTVKCADWLQGPYFYELYATKIDSRTGELYTAGAISALFLVGFTSSAVAGTALGSVTDTIGRTKGCLICAAVYLLDCFLAHGNTHLLLVLGRVCAGIASSLLHSVFESWLVARASALKPPPGWLDNLFSLQYFGDGIVAVMSGLLAELAATVGGAVLVFDVSAAMLVLAIGLILTLWEKPSDGSSVASPLRTGSAAGAGGQDAAAAPTVMTAVRVLLADSQALRLGLAQALFEGAMYSFVLVWVPALKARAGPAADLPLGIVFSGFMVSIMVGSSLFGLATGPMKLMTPIMALRVTFGLAAVALGPLLRAPSLWAAAVAFFTFEGCCGVYFPSSASVRAKIVPSDCAGPILTLFRLPLNVFVMVMLVNFEALGTEMVFVICSTALAVGAALMYTLAPASASKTTKPKAE